MLRNTPETLFFFYTQHNTASDPVLLRLYVRVMLTVFQVHTESRGVLRERKLFRNKSVKTIDKTLSSEQEYWDPGRGGGRGASVAELHYSYTLWSFVGVAKWKRTQQRKENRQDVCQHLGKLLLFIFVIITGAPGHSDMGRVKELQLNTQESGQTSDLVTQSSQSGLCMQIKAEKGCGLFRAYVTVRWMI